MFKKVHLCWNIINSKEVLRNVRTFGNNMLHSAETALYQSKHAITTLDNNQKGHPSKFQRFGSSHAFVKATKRLFGQFALLKIRKFDLVFFYSLLQHGSRAFD